MLEGVVDIVKSYLYISNICTFFGTCVIMDSKERIKRNMTTKQALKVTLELIGKNGMSGVVCEATSLPEALRKLGLDKLSSSTLQRVCAELHRQALVEITVVQSTYKLQLTVKGIHRLQRAQLDDIAIKEPVEWDGLWRMVTYDVPRTHSAKRRLFTEQLKRLGFAMVRESVWFHPNPCFDEVIDLARRCSVERYITLAEVSRLDNITLRKLRSGSYS